MPTGGELLVQGLEAAGTTVAFGLPGVHNLAAWKALAASDIRLVGVRHEQTAAYAADGYARATGRAGIALTTTGPGAANTLAAVGEAWASGSPVVVIGTDIPTTLRRAGVYRGVLHETTDQAGMFAPVTKACFRIESAADVAWTIWTAVTTAMAAPSRPVYVEIPTDQLAARTSDAVTPHDTGAPAPPAPEVQLLDRAAAVLLQAERPLIWAGGGAQRAGAGPAVAALAERLAAPVLLTHQGRGILPPDHPCLVGLPPHVPAAGELWDDADVVVAIGTDFDGMTTQNWAMPPPPRLIAINIDPDDAVKNYAADLVIAGDAAETVAALASRIPQSPPLDDLSADLADRRARARAELQDEHAEALAFLDVMAATVPDDAVVLADMCIPGYWYGAFGRVAQPRRLAYPIGWGTLGFAFPASIGAALAGTGPVVSLSGDGGFLFACGELATVAQEQLPVKAVVVDDGGYGMLRFDQIHAGDEPFGVDLRTPDFVALGRAFGIRSDEVDGLGEAFGAALSAHLALDEPTLLVARAALRPPPTTSPRWYRRRP